MIRGRLKLSRIAGLLVLIAGIVAALVVVLGGGAQSQAASPLSLGVLQLPISPLPPGVLAHAPFAQQLSNPQQARLALIQNGTSIYVSPGAGDTVCLVVTGPQGTGGTCGDTKALADHPAFLKVMQPDGWWDVFGLAADGFNTASTGGASATISNNAFFIEHVQQTDVLSVSGKAGSQTINIP